MAGEMDVYLCYRSGPGTTALCGWIRVVLQQRYGLRVAFQADKRDWEETWREEMRGAKVVVLLLSANSWDGEEQVREIEYAMSCRAKLVVAYMADFANGGVRTWRELDSVSPETVRQYVFHDQQEEPIPIHRGIEYREQEVWTVIQRGELERFVSLDNKTALLSSRGEAGLVYFSYVPDDFYLMCWVAEEWAHEYKLGGVINSQEVSWADRMGNIKRCNLMVVCLTATSWENREQIEEINYAKENGVRVVAFWLASRPMHGTTGTGLESIRELIPQISESVEFLFRDIHIEPLRIRDRYRAGCYRRILQRSSLSLVCRSPVLMLPESVIEEMYSEEYSALKGKLLEPGTPGTPNLLLIMETSGSTGNRSGDEDDELFGESTIKLKTRKPVAAGLRGSGGSGKTWLALRLGHDQDIRDYFQDRVLWVRMGRRPNLNELAEMVHLDLGGSKRVVEKKLADINEVRDAIAEKMVHSRCLLILDDLWNPEHANLFGLDFLKAKRNDSKIIITTRLPSVGAELQRSAVYIAYLDYKAPRNITSGLLRLMQNGPKPEKSEFKPKIAALFQYHPLAISMLAPYATLLEQENLHQEFDPWEALYDWVEQECFPADSPRRKNLGMFDAMQCAIELLGALETGTLKPVKDYSILDEDFEDSEVDDVHDAKKGRRLSSLQNRLSQISTSLSRNTLRRGNRQSNGTTPYKRRTKQSKRGGKKNRKRAKRKKGEVELPGMVDAYFDLGIFLEDQSFALEDIAMAWDMYDLHNENRMKLFDECARLVERFVNLSLLFRIGENEFVLHDIQSDFLQDPIDREYNGQEPNLSSIRARFFTRCVTTHRTLGWGLATRYVLVNLAQHAQMEGGEKDMKVVMLSRDWIRAKAGILSVRTLIAELQNYDEKACQVVARGLEQTFGISATDPAFDEQLWNRLSQCRTDKGKPAQALTSVIEDFDRARRRARGIRVASSAWPVLEASDYCLVRVVRERPVPVNAVSLLLKRPPNKSRRMKDNVQILAGANDNCLTVYQASFGKLVSRLKGHTDVILAVSSAVSAADPALSRIATASRDGTIRIWNGENGEEIHVLRASNEPVHSVSMVWDSKRQTFLVASGGNDAIVNVWDGMTAELKNQFKGHKEAILSVQIVLDDYVVSGSRDKRLGVWNMNTNQRMYKLKGHRMDVTSVSAAWLNTKLHEDDKSQVAPVADGIAGGTRDENEPRRRLIVVSGSHDTKINIWDATAGTRLHFLKGHEHGVVAVDIHILQHGDRQRGYALITSASLDGTLRIWEGLAGVPIHVFKGHTSWILGSSVLSNQSSPGDFEPKVSEVLICTSSRDGSVRFWDVSQVVCEHLRLMEKGSYEALHPPPAPTEDKGLFLPGGSGNMVSNEFGGDEDENGTKQPERASNHSKGNLKKDSSSNVPTRDSILKQGLAAVISSTSRQVDVYCAGAVEVSTRSSRVEVYKNVGLGQSKNMKHKVLARTSGSVDVSSILYQGTVLVGASDDRQIKIFHGSTGKVVGTLWNWTACKSLGLLAHKTSETVYVVCALEDHSVCLWNAHTKKLVHALTEPYAEQDPVNDVAIAGHYDKVIVASAAGNRVHLWNGLKGNLERVFDSHADTVTCVSLLAHEGKLHVASGSKDSKIVLHDGLTGKLMHVLEQHSGIINDLAFVVARDMVLLGSVSTDNTVKLWDGLRGRLMYDSGHSIGEFDHPSTSGDILSITMVQGGFYDEHGNYDERNIDDTSATNIANSNSNLDFKPRSGLARKVESNAQKIRVYIGFVSGGIAMLECDILPSASIPATFSYAANPS